MRLSYPIRNYAIPFNYPVVLLIFLLTIVIVSCRFAGSSPDFNVEDPAKVEFIGIYGADTVEIRKHNDDWVINGEEKPDPVALDNFLFAFQNIEITGATTGKEMDSLVSRKILIRTNGRKKMYRFYTGSEISLMHHEGSSEIYRIKISAVPDADLDKVFSDNVSDWKNRLIINIDPDMLYEVKVMPKPGIGQGYIMRKDDDLFRIFDLNGEEMDQNAINKEKTLLYSSYFKGIYYQEEIKNDSVINRISTDVPFYSFDIELPGNHQLIFSVYSLYDRDGSKDLFFGAVKFHDNNEILKVNYANLDFLFQDISYFSVE